MQGQTGLDVPADLEHHGTYCVGAGDGGQFEPAVQAEVLVGAEPRRKPKGKLRPMAGLTDRRPGRRDPAPHYYTQGGSPLPVSPAGGPEGVVTEQVTVKHPESGEQLATRGSRSCSMTTRRCDKALAVRASGRR